MGKKQITAGIDVGTTKIFSCIADLSGERVAVLGTGWAPSRGLKKGMVVNLSETFQSIKESLDRAESEANVVIESAYVSVGGRLLRSVNTSAETEIRGKSGRVSNEDISRAVLEAQQLQTPNDSEIIHVLTQSFRLDDQDGIQDPVGLRGSRLSVRLHVVFNATAVVQNIVSAINRADVNVLGVVMQQLASGQAVLTEDEKELGTVLIDVGGGTTDISVYNQGSIWHSEVLPMGGSLITKDIAIGLRAPLQEAERLKIDMGSVYYDSISDEETVEIQEIGTGRSQTFPRRLLCEIIEARCEEILQNAAAVIRRSGAQTDLLSGVVLTGGGALMHGFVERAQEILAVPVRLGIPIDLDCSNNDILHPAYATGLGLLKYAHSLRTRDAIKIAKESVSPQPKATTERLKNWIFEKI
jgi:cell division protein FtsA